MTQNISSQAQYLLQTWDQTSPKPTAPETTVITVNQMIGSIAWIYERIRNIVDLRDDHLIRKNAIERILKRRLLLQEKIDKIAKPLIEELIRAGYLPNKTLPETKITEVHQILDKYVYLIQHLPDAHEHLYTKKQLGQWLISLMACELEENLTSAIREKAIIDSMYDLVNPQLHFEEKYDPAEKDTQVYLATHRALVKSDPAMISFILFKLYHPNWVNNPTEELKAHLANHLIELKKSIDHQVQHPCRDRLWRILQRKAIPFLILKELLNKNPEENLKILANPELLETKIREICKQKYKLTRSRLTRGSIRSIAYIFITKACFALLLEIPFEWYITGEVNKNTLLINLVFQPILMFIIALTIRVPSEKNTKKIVQEIKYIVYGYPENESMHFRAAPRRSVMMKIMFSGLYALIFGVSFGLVSFSLYILHFNIFSGVVFIFFLCLVSFFGFKLRNSARELVVFERKEGWFSLFVDFLSIPLIRAGRFLSQNFAKINIFAFFLDVIFEAPFKLLLEILEDFFSYLKEKREEIY